MSGDRAEAAVVLSVIIPTFNARELLASCLESIYDNPPAELYEIIVVDDASADRTSEMVRARFPEVCLLRNEINSHYAASNNRAFKMARGEYLYLLNNDTVVLPHALDRMIAFLREHPDAGVVGSRLLNGDGTIQWSVKSLPNPGAALFGARSIITRMFPNNLYSRKHLLHLDRDHAKPFIAGYVSSASMMLPRKVFDIVGELDPRMSYHVDADYCKRIADAGYKCYYLPSATIVHFDHKGGTMVSLSRRFRSLVEFHRGSYIYYYKHSQKMPRGTFRLVVAVGLLGRLLLSLTAQVLVEFRQALIAPAAKNVASWPRDTTSETSADGASCRNAPSFDPRYETDCRPLRAAMRVLAHIHTFNDGDIIDRTVDAVLRQTRCVDEILIVDNASTDGTLEAPSVARAKVLRHPENRGTSGAVYSGFRYALEHDYDWIWVFDADSIPEPDALAQLLDLYAGFPRSLQDQTAFLACLHYNVQDGKPQHGGLFTRRGLAPSWPAPETRHYPAHYVIWSGCLYRVAAIREIGLPNPNYVLDWGEGEYGYRVMKAGYKGFVHQDAILHHNIRGHTSMIPVEVKLGPAKLRLYEFPPIRCYYTCRNVLYFGLYDFREERVGFMRGVGWRVFRMPLGFLLRPRTHADHILACIRGLWHGITGNIAARY